jgi:hypothetical protein
MIQRLLQLPQNSTGLPLLLVTFRETALVSAITTGDITSLEALLNDQQFSEQELKDALLLAAQKG